MPLLSALREWFIPSLMEFDNWIESGESVRNIAQYLVNYWLLALAFSAAFSHRNRIKHFGCDVYLTRMPNRKGVKRPSGFLQPWQEWCRGDWSACTKREAPFDHLHLILKAFYSLIFIVEIARSDLFRKLLSYYARPRKITGRRGTFTVSFLTR